MTGSGTQADPFVIWDAIDLQNMNLDLTAYYELGQDIDASATMGWNGGAGFVPIGPTGTPFTGTFDGKGYSITGLTINRPLDDDQGLFASTDGATIQNVSLVDVNILGDNDVGALVASADDTDITNCSVSGTVVADNLGGMLVGLFYSSSRTPTMSHCYSTGSLESPSQDGSMGNCGGLIGWVGGNTYPPVITKCYSTTSVTATGAGLASWLGGFIGYTQSAVISRCYATGTVIGNNVIAGFIAVTSWGGGSKVTTILDCYARGNCESTLPGIVAGFICDVNDVTDIDNCYSTGGVTGLAANTSGFIEDNFGNTGNITDSFWNTETSGQATSDGGTGKTTAQMKASATFIDAGWDFSSAIWAMAFVAEVDDYPVLSPIAVSVGVT